MPPLSSQRINRYHIKKRKQLPQQPSDQIDTDAASTKKGGTYYFGYKGHIGVDAESKLIRKLRFTSAKPHDSTQLDQLISGDEKALFGDKAYDNQDHKRRACKEGVRSTR